MTVCYEYHSVEQKKCAGRAPLTYRCKRTCSMNRKERAETMRCLLRKKENQDIPERVNQSKAQSTKMVMITLTMLVYTPPFIIMEEYCL